MTYQIEFANKVVKQFKTLSSQVQAQLKTKIDELSTNPRPYGVTKLAGEDDLYRIRSGDYRIIYMIQDRQLLILVVKIGHRKDVYR